MPKKPTYMQNWKTNKKSVVYLSEVSEPLEKRIKNLEKKIEKVLGLAEKIIDTLSEK